MQNGFARLFLVLVTLLLLTGGIYFYKTTNQETPLVTPVNTIRQAELKNYLNSELGFEFTYPQNFTVKTDSEEEYNKRGKTDFKKNFQSYVGYVPPKTLGAVVVLEDEGNFENNPFSVWVFDNSSGLSPESWFNNFWYYPFLWGVFDWTSKGHIALDKEATISGLMGKSKVVSYQAGQPKFIYISKDKKMYLFRVIGRSGEKILSAVKLLK